MAFVVATPRRRNHRGAPGTIDLPRPVVMVERLPRHDGQLLISLRGPGAPRKCASGPVWRAVASYAFAEAMAALDASDWTVASAKFLSPVEPGMALTLAHAVKGPDTIEFEIASPRGIVATGTLARS